MLSRFLLSKTTQSRTPMQILNTTAKRQFAIQRARPSLRPRTTLQAEQPANPQQQPQYQQQPHYQQQPNQPPLEHYHGQPLPQTHQQGHYYPQQLGPNGQPLQPGQPGYVPMQQQQQPPQSLGSTVAGGILDGVTFGVGSSLAHRAMDGVMGPRTVQVEHINAGQPMDAAATAPMGSPIGGDTGMQSWQAPSDPYGQPAMEDMSWANQEQAAMDAAGSFGTPDMGDVGGEEAGEGAIGFIKGVWNFFND